MLGADCRDWSEQDQNGSGLWCGLLRGAQRDRLHCRAIGPEACIKHKAHTSRPPTHHAARSRPSEPEARRPTSPIMRAWFPPRPSGRRARQDPCLSLILNAAAMQVRRQVPAEGAAARAAERETDRGASRTRFAFLAQSLTLGLFRRFFLSSPGAPLHGLATGLFHARPDVQPSSPPVPDLQAQREDLILCAHAFVWVTPGAISQTRLGAIGYHPPCSCRSSPTATPSRRLWRRDAT